MEHIGIQVAAIEQNILIKGADLITQHGFTMVANVMLRHPDLFVGAKVVFAMFLSYCWANSRCFPGQDRLADDIGMSRVRVTQLIGELEDAGLIEITRRGQGKTNIYTLDVRHSVQGKPRKAGTSRNKQTYIWM